MGRVAAARTPEFRTHCRRGAAIVVGVSAQGLVDTASGGTILQATTGTVFRYAVGRATFMCAMSVRGGRLKRFSALTGLMPSLIVL